MEADVVRQQSFEVDGVAEVDVSLIAGGVRVHLVDEPGVHVEIRQSAGEPWTAGLNNLLSWVNDQFGGGRDAGAGDAVRGARVELAGRRVRVQSSEALALRAVALDVTVRAPIGSNVTAKTGAADVTVTGPAGRLDVKTGTGHITADRADGAAQINTAAGKVRLGPMLGGLRAKTGRGDIEVSSVGGHTVLFTGTGDVWLGAVQDDVQVRTGSGDVTVADAASGRIQMGTGSGDVRVGVRPGVTAKIDLVSTSGSARSDLAVSDTPPADGEATLHVTGRTASGDALVTTSNG
ncbi:DUF4097 family beta strand repeat-containing protein [Saccharothrix obliqua]|uniref:DUF4097 family beta strand repeat-containing protein n=1 Tax=Saccharothrix obliqua TaxID=2861747 RepID=UPI0027E26D9A|nr:DUF4097 family beta strand repeat-containing protein [Saccharothrix obliqua]